MIILKILLAAVILLVVLALAAYFWIKRKIVGFAATFEAANRLVDPAYYEPASLSLVPVIDSELGEHFATLTDEFSQHGFVDPKFLEDRNHSTPVVVMRHKSQPIAAALRMVGWDVDDPDLRWMMFHADEQRRVMGRGSGPGQTINLARVDWQVSSDLSIADALDELTEAAPSDPLPMDLSTRRSVVEQIHTLNVQWLLRTRPTRAEVVSRLRAQGEDAPETEAIDSAYGAICDAWDHLLYQYATSRYLRESKIDAATWSELEDDIVVVHDHLDVDSLAETMGVDDVTELLVRQLAKQGLTGHALFEAVVEESPPQATFRKLGEVKVPFVVAIYTRSWDTQSQGPRLSKYVYEGKAASGERMSGLVVALSEQRATQQLQRLRVGDAKIKLSLTAETMGDMDIDDLLEHADLMIESVDGKIWSASKNAFINNWLLWLPTTVLFGWSLADGAPFTVSDYVIFLFFALSVAAMLCLVGPIVAYDMLLRARCQLQPRKAHYALLFLRTFNLIGALTPQQIVVERANVLSLADREEDARALLETNRAMLGEHGYFTALGALLVHQGQWSEAIAAQQKSLEHAEDKALYTVELAGSIVRYTDRIDDADALLGKVDRNQLAELTRFGFDFATGMIAAARGQHDQALSFYAQALETSTAFAGNPLIKVAIAEVNARAAISLRRVKKEEDAQALWLRAWPIIGPHSDGAVLREAFDAAISS